MTTKNKQADLFATEPEQPDPRYLIGDLTAKCSEGSIYPYGKDELKACMYDLTRPEMALMMVKYMADASQIALLVGHIAAIVNDAKVASREVLNFVIGRNVKNALVRETLSAMEISGTQKMAKALGIKGIDLHVVY